MGSELLRSGMQGFGYSPGRKESSKAQIFNIIHSTQLIFTAERRAGVCPVLFHAMFASLVQVEGLCWTRFRKLPKWLPALSYLQQSILASVSMTTTTTLWWHPLLLWRWQCQHVPTTSNPMATEVSHAQILKADFKCMLRILKNWPFLLLAASHRCPGQAGGGWEETDSGHSSSHNSSQETAEASQTSLGGSSKSGGSGSHSGASRESGDLSER